MDPHSTAHPNTQSVESRGWHSRGYMPHLNSNDLVQHVTFHLADSLPMRVIEEKAVQIEALDPSQRESARRQGLETLIDAGYGSCILAEPDIAAMVQEALLHFDGLRYRMLAWVVMPNHVHALFHTMNGWSISSVVGSWKKWTGNRIREWRIQHGLTPAAEAEAERIWQREYWDRFIRDEKHYAAALEYIETNPVKAGLVRSAELWQWSSASAPRSR